MASVPASNDITVLHVDDEPDLADVVATFLERERPELSVRTATDPREGLDVFESDQVECIVSDYDMPGMDGLDLLRTVREDHPDLPFVLFTGKGSEEIASDAISAGVTDYLQKEGGTDQYGVLANRVVNAVERYRAERELERYETVVEAVDDLVYAVDDEGRFLFVNEAQQSMTGYDREELLGDHIHSLMADEGIQTAREQIELLRESDRDSTTFEREAITADGDRIHCEDHMALLPADDDEFRGTAGIVRDITERKRRERALERQQARLEEVADVVETDLSDAVTDLRDLAADADDDLAATAARIERQFASLRDLVDARPVEPIDTAGTGDPDP